MQTKTPKDYTDLAGIYQNTLDGRLIAPGTIKNVLEELAGLRGRKEEFDAAAAAQSKIATDAAALAAETKAEQPAQ